MFNIFVRRLTHTFITVTTKDLQVNDQFSIQGICGSYPVIIKEIIPNETGAQVCFVVVNRHRDPWYGEWHVVHYDNGEIFDIARPR